MLPILIFDDNPMICQELQTMITTQILPEQVIVKTATDAETARQILQEGVSVLLLDIQLKENENGIAFAKDVHKRYPTVKVIFITAYIQYCEAIFTAEPVGFLVKPFTADRVRRALKIATQTQMKQDVLVFHVSKNQTISVELNKIAFIESSNRKLRLCEENGIALYEMAEKISEIDSKIPAYFCRCHHSFLVNLHYVREIKRYAFVLKSDVSVPISQQKFKSSKAAFSAFLGESV